MFCCPDNGMGGLSAARIQKVQERILSFYQKNGRDLPWRRTTDPYHILVSEVMLQQTQVDRVLQYYRRWVERWPAIQDLAQARRSKVLEQWMGLGYNNRAVNLHTTAHRIVSEHNGDVLTAMNDYKSLPGIGPYIANAVRIFSTNKDIVTIDTNIRRILIHEFGLDEPVSDKQLWILAERCLPKGRSREWHNALMDYGALVMTSRKTGIRPKTRQSRFDGSDRQIRARLMRYLLKMNGPAPFSSLQTVVLCGPARLERILQGLVKDGLITCRNGKYSVKE